MLWVAVETILILLVLSYFKREFNYSINNNNIVTFYMLSGMWRLILLISLFLSVGEYPVLIFILIRFLLFKFNLFPFLKINYIITYWINSNLFLFINYVYKVILIILIINSILLMNLNIKGLILLLLILVSVSKLLEFNTFDITFISISSIYLVYILINTLIGFDRTFNIYLIIILVLYVTTSITTLKLIVTLSSHKLIEILLFITFTLALPITTQFLFKLMLLSTPIYQILILFLVVVSIYLVLIFLNSVVFIN
jgi:hypothetical protein